MRLQDIMYTFYPTSIFLTQKQIAMVEMMKCVRRGNV